MMIARTKFLPYFVAFLTLAFFPSTRANAASADDFRTPEYLTNGKAYDWIKAADAYALGLSGKGVTVGVLDDSAWAQHPEFAAKSPYPIWGDPSDFVSSHGMHTNGTVAASKDGYGMHGIAWGANLVSAVTNFSNNSLLQRLLSFAAYDVSIISNSWGGEMYLGSWSSNLDAAFFNNAVAMGTLAAQRDILFVFAAGNEGQSSPGEPASAPSWALGWKTAGVAAHSADTTLSSLLTPEERRALSLNVISVSAFNPAATVTSSLDFIAPFTDMTDGATDYSLFAPGMGIYSSVHPHNDSQPGALYAAMGGTSMATPMVSGAAALVKEAFPFMGGKQMADTLLSTAQPISGANRPPFLVLLRTESDLYDPHTKHYSSNFIVPSDYTYDGGIGGAAIKNYLENPAHSAEYAFLREYMAAYGIDLDADLAARLSASNADPGDYGGTDPANPQTLLHIITPDEYRKLFGMGILDIARAVRGPGWLDAHRLENTDKQTFGGTNYAMYPVDTKGYSGVWSNDIAQVVVNSGNNYPGYDFGPSYPNPASNEFFRGLAGLDVGLLKTGAGTLTLTGANTYLGPTVVRGGEIALGRPGQANGVAELAGDVRVESGGTFSGNGLARQKLYSEGILAPGFATVPGSALTVTGDLTSSGTLLFPLWDNNVPALLVNGAGGADIAGSTIALAGMDGRRPLPSGSYTLMEANSMSGNFRNDTATALQGVSLWHDFNLSVTGNGITATYARSAAAPQAKALSEGFLSNAALLNQGADLVAGAGITNAVSATTTTTGGGGGVTALLLPSARSPAAGHGITLVLT